MAIAKNREKIILTVIAFVTAILFFVLANTSQAQAASITQTGQTQTDITVSWKTYAQQNPSSNYTMLSQNIQVGTDSKTAQAAKKISLGANTTSYKISGLKGGNLYYVILNFTYSKDDEEQAATYSGSYSGKVKTLPGQVKGVKQARWWYYTKKVDFKWTVQNGVDGYQWTVKKASSGKTIKTGKSNNKSSNPEARCDIKNNVVYTVTVCAYSTINNQTYWGAASKTAYLFTQPMCNKKTKAKNGKLKISWGKIAGVTGYKVYVSTKEKSGYKRVKTVSKKKKSISIKKFKGARISKYKSYYVYVVAQKKVGSTKYKSGKHYTFKVNGSSKPVIYWSFN